MEIITFFQWFPHKLQISDRQGRGLFWDCNKESFSLSVYIFSATRVPSITKYWIQDIHKNPSVLRWIGFLFCENEKEPIAPLPDIKNYLLLKEEKYYNKYHNNHN